jgi:hypothetical protein
VRKAQGWERETRLELLAEQTVAVGATVGYDQESKAGMSPHAHV